MPERTSGTETPVRFHSFEFVAAFAAPHRSGLCVKRETLIHHQDFCHYRVNISIINILSVQNVYECRRYDTERFNSSRNSLETSFGLIVFQFPAARCRNATLQQHDAATTPFTHKAVGVTPVPSPFLRSPLVDCRTTARHWTWVGSVPAGEVTLLLSGCLIQFRQRHKQRLGALRGRK